MRKQDKLALKSETDSRGREPIPGAEDSPASGSGSQSPVPPHGDPLRDQIRGGERAKRLPVDAEPGAEIDIVADTESDALSSETAIVGSRSVYRRHFRAKEAQVHRHLATVMRRVQERVANHVMTRLLERELTAGQQTPRGGEVRIGCPAERLARL